MRTWAVCSVCGKGPFMLSNLYKHMRNSHHYFEEDVEEVKRAIKRAIYPTELKCNVCGKSYFSEAGLREHKRAHAVDGESPSTSNNTGRKSVPQVECPGCKAVFVNHLQLSQHCQKNHNDGSTNFNTVKKTFGSWSRFETWLAEMERATITRFVKRSNRKSSKGVSQIYICQHARGNGGTVDPKQMRKRYRETKRVHKNCPSFAKALERRDGLVEAEACFGHLGHEVSTALMPLSKDDVEIVKSMLLAGVPPGKIVSELHDKNFLPDVVPERQPRLYYLTPRDVTNIASRFKITVANNDRSVRTRTRSQKAPNSKPTNTFSQHDEISHNAESTYQDIQNEDISDYAEDNRSLTPASLSDEVPLQERLEEALREAQRIQAQVGKRARLYYKNERLDLLEELNGKLLDLATLIGKPGIIPRDWWSCDTSIKKVNKRHLPDLSNVTCHRGWRSQAVHGPSRDNFVLCVDFSINVRQVRSSTHDHNKSSLSCRNNCGNGLKSDDDTCLLITMQATSVVVFFICLCYIEGFPPDAMIGIKFSSTERNERDAIEPEKLVGVRELDEGDSSEKMVGLTAQRQTRRLTSSFAEGNIGEDVGGLITGSFCSDNMEYYRSHCTNFVAEDPDRTVQAAVLKFCTWFEDSDPKSLMYNKPLHPRNTPKDYRIRSSEATRSQYPKDIL
ncbi:unnamed protein product [Cylicocyclus nassatus]|uniref:C2H2-type domain-containing protein n=1 Tax=Cylicocyclus nassatus TaxID=53992 RepID=A0AA36GXF2_CYLNA|nr:unnamed protein product [Cylicocyclus nassatus]